MEDASQVLEDVIQMAEAAHDERTLSYALDNASGVYLLRGEFDKTVQYVQRALDLMERLGDPLMIALLILRRGMNQYVLGEWKQAYTDFEQAHQMTRQLGISWVSAYTSLGLGQICLALGDWQRATGLLEDSVALAERSGDLQALRWAEATLAEYDLWQGRPESARVRLEPLLDRPGQQEGLVTYLLPYLAWAYLDLGNARQAEIYVTQCLLRATGERIRLAWVDALRVYALLAMHFEESAEAAGIIAGTADTEAGDALDKGIRLAAEMHFPYGEAKVRYTQGLLALHRSRRTEARQSLVAAQAILETLGEHLYLERVLQLLADLA